MLCCDVSPKDAESDRLAGIGLENCNGGDKLRGNLQYHAVSGMNADDLAYDCDFLLL